MVSFINRFTRKKRSPFTLNKNIPSSSSYRNLPMGYNLEEPAVLHAPSRLIVSTNNYKKNKLQPVLNNKSSRSLLPRTNNNNNKVQSVLNNKSSRSLLPRTKKIGNNYYNNINSEAVKFSKKFQPNTGFIVRSFIPGSPNYMRATTGLQFRGQYRPRMVHRPGNRY